ncbi:MAG: DUF1294 domain-containing protein [Clostridia bacterium]|nr:DUF1294 domain-containing protein [Clostridia bacterium]
MQYIPYIYFTVISVTSIIYTVSDKIFATNNKRRISEKALFVLASLGGSLAMFCTMQIIRHKTKHFRFMIGLPFIMLLQLVIPTMLFILK